MRANTQVLLAALAVCGAMFMAPTARAQHYGVSAELTSDQSIFLADEDMDVKVHITNRSGQTLALGDGNDWLDVSIQGEANYMPDKKGEIPLDGKFTLGSGMVATGCFNPAPYFDIRRPGHYTIRATVNIPQWNQGVVCKASDFHRGSRDPVAGIGSAGNRASCGAPE